jgi:serine/threonine protein kinase
MNYPITFGRYLLLERINVGGMAEVFKAKTFGVEGFERILAIKRILPNMADDDEFINMFVDEARIAVQLNHANIVQIYELGKYEGQYYIAMEYVSGKDLRQILDHCRKKKELLPVPAAAFLASKICDGLDYAHRRSDPTGRPLNVIHRDVSPQNILVSWEGAVKITDFGIAKAEDRASRTQAGVLKGKFGYMSPEQVRGLEIDHRSDIFALGILMYEMMTGQRLFLGDSDFSTLERVRNAEVTPPTEHNPQISPELERVLLKALARERDERYQWASELHDDLQQFLIEDNTIFNAKRLAGHFQLEYADTIAREMQKMEEFMKMAAPASAEAIAAAEEMKMAASRSDSSVNEHAERTMIFESEFFESSDQPTQIHGDDSTGWPANSEAGQDDEARSGSAVGPPRFGPPSETSDSGFWLRVLGAFRQQKHAGAILIAAAAFVSLLSLLILLLTGPSGDVGTIVVTSSPTDAIEVFLDGALIGDRTPFSKRDVLLGEHILLARSSGYADRAYRFELVAGNPAVIHIELEPEAPAADAVLLVISEPPGASVRVGGAPMGVTPRTLTNMDSTQPVIVEIALDGYQTVTRTFTFPPGHKQGKVEVTLEKGVAAGGSNGQGRIIVRSRPEGATVYLGRDKVGGTPVELSNIDVSRPHTLELAKDGYRTKTVPVAFRGDTVVAVDVVLEVLAEAPRKERVPRDPKPPRRISSGGRCSGDGARISVMPIGQADCVVTVGKSDLGVAPFFKKASPVGKCDVRVACPNGKRYRTVKNIGAGADVKVIIKPGDWR